MACYRRCKKTTADEFAKAMKAGEAQRKAAAAEGAARVEECCKPELGTTFVPLGCAGCKQVEKKRKADEATKAEAAARKAANEARDNKACTASENFKDTKAPTLKLCQPTATTVNTASTPSWDLCEASAMDQMDGDVTSSIKYTVVRLGADGAPEYLARDASFGAAKARFRANGKHGVPGPLVNGNYLVSMKVQDAAGNAVESDEEITVTQVGDKYLVQGVGHDRQISIKG